MLKQRTSEVLGVPFWDSETALRDIDSDTQVRILSTTMNDQSSELIESLRELSRVLGNLHELDWFHRLGGVVEYKNLEDVKIIKQDVDHVIGGLSILYLFAIFELYFDRNLWDRYVEDADAKILKAYRHIRHSIAHGHHGLRAQPRGPRNQEEYDAFDEAIRDGLFHPRNIITLDSNNTFKIDPTVGIYLKQHMSNTVQHTIAQVAKEV